MEFDVQGKTALITGGNRGIGASLVHTLLGRGAVRVYLAVRKPESTLELEQRYGSRVCSLPADMGDGDSIRALPALAPDVQLVINNAGVLERLGVLDGDAEASLRRQLEVNLFGLLRLAQAFAPLLEQQHGAFVQLNSIASLSATDEVAHYAASKHAAYALTQALKQVLGPRGVHVLSVHPGPIETDMVKGASFESAAVSSDCVGDGIVEALAAGRFLLFPDPVAKTLEEAYRPFARQYISGTA